MKYDLPPVLSPAPERDLPSNLWSTIEAGIDSPRPFAEPRKRARWLAPVVAASMLIAGLAGGVLLQPAATPTTPTPSLAPAATGAAPTKSASPTKAPIQFINSPISDAEAAPYLRECENKNKMRADGGFDATGGWKLWYAATYQPGILGTASPSTTMLMMASDVWFTLCVGQLGSMEVGDGTLVKYDPPPWKRPAPAEAELVGLVNGSGGSMTASEPLRYTWYQAPMLVSVSPKVASIRGRSIINGKPTPWLYSQPSHGLAYLPMSAEAPGGINTLVQEIQVLAADGTVLPVIQTDETGRNVRKQFEFDRTRALQASLAKQELIMKKFASSKATGK